MTIRGYDEWKTAAPEPIEVALFVNVDEGNLVLTPWGASDEDRIAGRVEIGDCGCDGETPEADNARIVEELRRVIRGEYPAQVIEFVCSSSVDFADEYGVRRPVDIRALLTQALEREAKMRVFFVRWSVSQNGRAVGRSRGGTKSAVVLATDKADAQARVMAQEDVGAFRSFDYEVYEPKGDVVGVGGFNSLEVRGA